MKQLLLSLVKDFITAGLKTLIALHKVKHGPEKNATLVTTVHVLIDQLKPITTETKTHVDDDIIEILENAINNNQK